MAKRKTSNQSHRTTALKPIRLSTLFQTGRSATAPFTDAPIGKDGKEYDVALTDDENGNHYGTIYGDKEEGAEYAMTTRDDNEALSVLINLSQLNRFPIHYKIYNCHVILTSDEGQDLVEIEKLDDQEFIAKGKSGKTYKFKVKQVH